MQVIHARIGPCGRECPPHFRSIDLVVSARLQPANYGRRCLETQHLKADVQ